MSDIKYGTIIESEELSSEGIGGGYSYTTITFKEFKDKEEMLDWIKRQESLVFNKPKYRIIKFSDAKVNVTTDIKISVE